GRAVEVDRRVGRELERVVLDLDLGRPAVMLRQPGQGGLEPPLADVAPGARDVGPDVDLEGLEGLGCRHTSANAPPRESIPAAGRGAPLGARSVALGPWRSVQRRSTV